MYNMFAIFFALTFLFNSFDLSFSIFLNTKSHSFRSINSFLHHSSVHAVGTNEEKLGIVIIDHGSKMNEANENLEKIVSMYKIASADSSSIVEAAHMEIVEPSIATAFRRCVDQGATFIICYPFFLSRGKHVKEDIPFLVEEASKSYPLIKYTIANHLGSDMDGLIQVMTKSVKNMYP